MPVGGGGGGEVGGIVSPLSPLMEHAEAILVSAIQQDELF